MKHLEESTSMRRRRKRPPAILYDLIGVGIAVLAVYLLERFLGML